MFYVSEVKTDVPKEFKTTLQEKVYTTLNELNIPYERVENDEAITMEDCILIDERLDTKIVKTLFLCNRQQTNFYLFITLGDKPFKTKDFSSAMGISRVSFAPSEFMDGMLGTVIGSTTVLSILLESSKDVQVVVDSEILKNEYYGCADGTTIGYMKIETSKVFDDLFKHCNRTYSVVEV